MLGVLGAIWGAAFMLIEIGLRDFEPSTGVGTAGVLGALAVVVATAFYAVGALYVSRRLRGLSAFEVSFGLLAWSALVTLPAGAAQLDGGEVGWGPAAAVLALGVVATAVAFQPYFGLIAAVGAARAILVTYLVPSLALVYGIVLLDEPFTWIALGGLGLVLAGVGLGTGAVRRRLASPG